MYDDNCWSNVEHDLQHSTVILKIEYLYLKDMCLVINWLIQQRSLEWNSILLLILILTFYFCVMNAYCNKKSIMEAPNSAPG